MIQLIATMKALFTDDRNDDGATAVEYGLMVSLIAVAIIAAVTLIGTNLNNIFALVAAAL